MYGNQSQGTVRCYGNLSVHKQFRMFHMKEKLFNWVENKIGDRVDAEIETSIQNKVNLDVEKFATELVNDVFNDIELKKLREKILAEKELESDFSAGDTDELLDTDGLNLSTLSIEEYGNEPVYRELLQLFEYQSVDEILCQPEWTETRRVLQTMLLPAGQDGKVIYFALKVFRRLLTSHHSPKTVCEGFASLSESISFQIDAVNKRVNTIESEELYDIRENKVYRRSSQKFEPVVEPTAVDTLVRSMYLLISAHENMPGLWVRFGEKRLQEIIFAFINLLSISFFVEKRNVSSLDVITILQPKATWGKHWTHSATGRTLLCQAFRKHRRLFNGMVEKVITGVLAVQDKKQRKQSGAKKTTEPIRSILGVPEPALQTASFCHCFSLLTYLVQYRAGRSLFPIQTSLRRRPWTAQDMIALMVDYIQLVHSQEQHSPFYQHHLMDMARILLSVEEEISTARGTQIQRRR